jgi:putative ABC transport system permease protein
VKLWNRIQYWLNRRQFEKELADELRFHRDMMQQDLELSSEAAARRLGNTTLAAEESRSVWTFAWLESLAQDLRYALRGFLQRPAFAFTVIGTIGLALGLNTTLFTIANAYVLRPFAVRDPHALYLFQWKTKETTRYRFSWTEFDHLRQSGAAFSDVMALELLIARVEGRGTLGLMVSPNYFDALGVQAAMGRTLLKDDGAVPGTGAVIVISDAIWRTRLGADPNVLGRKLQIHGQSLEIVGIMKPDFTGIDSTPIDFWVPLGMSPLMDADASLFGPQHPAKLAIVGRLKPQMSASRAKAELAVWARRMTADRNQSERATGINLIPRATAIPLNAEVVAVFSPLVVAFVLVLLIACANVANMMLARGLARQREIGIRLSLGAGRSRLIRQLLTESLSLAFPAAALGFAISELTVDASQRLMFATLPPEFARLIHVVDLAPDFRVFQFLLLAALVSTVAFGFAPALQVTRAALVEANRGDFSSSFRPARLRNALVIGQVAVCALLLITSAIVLRNGRSMATRDSRLDTHNVIDIRMQERFQLKAAARLRSEQWVDTVATASSAPLYGSLTALAVTPAGSSQENPAGYKFVSPEYFSFFRIPLRRGRNFTLEESNAEAPLAIISEATAARLWPNQDPLGQTLRFSPRATLRRYQKLPEFASARVIGVVGDVMSGWIGDGLDATCIYFPTNVGHPMNQSLLVRVKGDPEAIRSQIDATLTAVVPGAADQINPMDQVLAVQIYPFRAALWITGFLGVLALVLAVSGIYGVLSYLVSQRTREIGIRIALGASIAAVVRFVLSQSMRLTLAGIAVGLVLALAVARLVASRLLMLNFFDWLAYLAAVLAIGASALAASFFPAQRAAKVDPASTLRCD